MDIWYQHVFDNNNDVINFFPTPNLEALYGIMIRCGRVLQRMRKLLEEASLPHDKWVHK